MQNFIAKADKKTSSSNKQYSLYIGRWQPWHQGHRWLIDQRLKEDKNILLCIRDVPKDEKNPFTTEEVVANLEKELADLIAVEKVKLLVIPDIESVNYGRGVGYDIIEHVPPQEIKEISATKIREQLKADGKL